MISDNWLRITGVLRTEDNDVDTISWEPAEDNSETPIWLWGELAATDDERQSGRAVRDGVPWRYTEGRWAYLSESPAPSLEDWEAAVDDALACLDTTPAVGDMFSADVYYGGDGWVVDLTAA